MDQQEAGKHPEGAGGQLLHRQGLLKGAVPEAQQKAAVTCRFGADCVCPGNGSGKSLHDVTQAFRVISFHILDNIGNVFAITTEMPLRSSHGQVSGCVRDEGTERPALDKSPEGDKAGILPEGAQNGYARPASIVEFHNVCFCRAARLCLLPGTTFSPIQYQQGNRLAVLLPLSFLSEPFPGDIWSSLRIAVYRQARR